MYKYLSKPTQNNAKVKPLSIISCEIKPMLLHMLEAFCELHNQGNKKKKYQRRCNWHFSSFKTIVVSSIRCIAPPHQIPKNAPHNTSHQSAQRNKKPSWDLLPIFTQTKINSPCNAWLNVTMLQAFHAKSLC